MAITVYSRTLPNLNRAIVGEVYRRLVLLIDHLESFNIFLLGFSLDPATRVVTITLSDPIPADNIAHLNLEGP